MEALVNYIKPELLITAIALYFMGIALKEAQAVKDKYIPLILGCAGILICGIYVFATCSCKNAQDIAMAVFTSTTQGVLVAGLSTYVNQLIKNRMQVICGNAIIESRRKYIIKRKDTSCMSRCILPF